VKLPREHPRRYELNAEIHARPAPVLEAPLQATYLVMVSHAGNRTRELEAVTELAERFGEPAPANDSNHETLLLGDVQLVWERHTEFARYTFLTASSLEPGEPSHWRPVYESLAPDWFPQWIEELPGELLYATHAALLPSGGEAADRVAAERLFGDSLFAGAAVSGGSARAYSDIDIQADGFGRVLLFDDHLEPQQSGRLLQRVLEIGTYWTLALLALPVSRELGPFLESIDARLQGLADELVEGSAADEAEMLDELTRLEAMLSSRAAATGYRFNASFAYYDLVRRRINDLRESRCIGLQTFAEFTERRLAPAIRTFRTMEQRQGLLIERLSRLNQLLETRVGMTRELQNQQILSSVDRRAKLQLRLQQTVEGLSVAAITYYVVGLVGYLAEGLAAASVPVDASVAKGASIPVVALLAALTVRRIRRHMAADE